MPFQAPIEQASATPERHLEALLHTVAIAPLTTVGWMRVTGEDRVRWLNGMVTNSIPALQPGHGNYSFALNAQGHIQGDLTTFAQPDALLLQTTRTQVPTLIAHFDRFIIMDDVELQDISPTRFGLQLAGPDAPDLLTRLGLPIPAPMTLATLPWHNAAVQVIASHSPLVPRFELWSDELTHHALQLATTGAVRVDPQAIEHLRLLEGTPLYGTDILSRNLPQETAQTRALHFAKGCYLGQEIVERIRSRGSVHRALTAFRLDGPLPATGTPLSADAKPIAELTTVAAIPLPAGLLQIGLGIARREPIDRAATLTYTTADGPGIALPVNTPIDLPIHPE